MRRVATLVVLTIVAAAVLAGNGAGTTANPTLYFEYSMNCTLSIIDDSGKLVTSVVPGRYQIDIRTPVPFATLPMGDAPGMTACQGIPQFQLTGPGINFFTTMSAGCVDDLVVPETFQANATYVATDLNQPSVARASFTTLASGTPGQTAVTYGGGKGVAQSQDDIVGSSALKGTIDASIGATGAAKLTFRGKAVSKLAAGRYTFRIIGPTGLKLLGPKSKSPKVLSRRTATVSLTAGKWTYYTSLRNFRYFNVT
ncbi:MAG TPA: hypothetical protein VGL76_12490 [Gaiellaceae bacterium]